mmetsp:Transcript_75101/g.168166  ORF Transcript_75101/g.168166 Transcript_75101/m.168166 type:complete len:205 (-) Transcript_75101:243-857(-)
MGFVLERVPCLFKARLQVWQLTLDIFLEAAVGRDLLRPRVLLVPSRPCPLDGIAQLGDEAEVGHQALHGPWAAPTMHVGRGELASEGSGVARQPWELRQILFELLVVWLGVGRVATELLEVAIEPQQLFLVCWLNLRMCADDVVEGRRSTLLGADDHEGRQTSVRERRHRATWRCPHLWQHHVALLHLPALPSQEADHCHVRLL